LLGHLAQDEPWHRGAKLDHARDLDPLVLREILHIKSKIARVGCAPWASPSDGISLEPVFFRYLSGRLGIASGMAIIASSDLDDISTPLLGFLVHPLYLTDRGYLFFSRGSGHHAGD